MRKWTTFLQVKVRNGAKVTVTMKVKASTTAHKVKKMSQRRPAAKQW
jgi:hypothetical protein